MPKNTDGIVFSFKKGLVRVGTHTQTMEFTDIDDIDNYIWKLLGCRNNAFPDAESVFRRRQKRKAR